ncbi:restriction endonuclease subunit S [Burkholderia stagnalis]|uniref:restriction endonuclease subunit S n=1 Tax=Burkholderia stagnalis TaxID=1503054 RepID=UPI000F5AC0C3|nr:restriction endonuclease subunit S [Burkholderia stagnalis]RQQ24573.1 restriction endonuclease subunit S [Burkholderia stagnalis]
MSRWQTKTIAEVCEVNPRLPRDHGIDDGQLVSFVPMAAIDELSGAIRDRQVRPFAEVRKGYTHFKNGDVLFAKITPCMENGKAAVASDLVGGLGFGSTEFHVLRAKEMVLPEWLFYFVRRPSFRSEAKRNFTGTAGQQRVPTTFLSSVMIPVPPLDEQRRIVDLLSRAEGIVRLRREAQTKAQAIIPALFVDMFGDPATNPKRWPMSAIEDLCSVRTGATPRREQRLYYDGGTIPWVKTGEVCESSIVDVEEHITEKAVEETNCKVFPVNTILVAMYGQGQTRGRVGLLKVSAATNQACAAILPGERINQNFLYALLMMQYERLRAMGRGGNQANLNLGMIKSFRVPCPPLAAQLHFEERRESVVSITAQQAEALKKAEDVFASIVAHSFGN